MDAVNISTQQELILKERKANNAWNKIKRNKTAMIGLFIVGSSEGGK